MNKAEFINAIAEKTGVPKKKVEEVIGGFTDVVTDALKNGDSVQITGFGKFTVAKRAAKAGRNPSTGEPMTIAARMSPKFIPGKLLKDAVNG